MQFSIHGRSGQQKSNLAVQIVTTVAHNIPSDPLVARTKSVLFFVAVNQWI